MALTHYSVEEVSLPDLDAAIEYVLERQEGKRNATPQDLSNARGKLYRRRKKNRSNPTGTNQHSKSEETRQNDGNPSFGDTASSVGKETGVSAVSRVAIRVASPFRQIWRNGCILFGLEGSYTGRQWGFKSSF